MPQSVAGISPSSWTSDKWFVGDTLKRILSSLLLLCRRVKKKVPYFCICYIFGANINQLLGGALGSMIQVFLFYSSFDCGASSPVVHFTNVLWKVNNPYIGLFHWSFFVNGYFLYLYLFFLSL